MPTDITMVFSVVKDDCESWVLLKSEEDKWV